MAKTLRQNNQNRAQARWKKFKNNPNAPSTYADRAKRYSGTERRDARAAMIALTQIFSPDRTPAITDSAAAHIETGARSTEAAELNKKRGKGKNSHYKLTGLGTTNPKKK